MIQIQNVSKVYDKRGIAGLHEVSFSVNAGEVVALMGPNGSGKSTLLKIISGLMPLEKGQITLSGPCAFFDPTAAPDKGNVQKFLIASVTVTEDEEKKLQLTRDLADVMEFTFQLRQDLADLSAGQRQKVLLASLLINRPSLVLLDEPFTHLDPMTRKVVLESLFDYIRNHSLSVLWVTHDLNEALLYSHKLAVLNFGKLAQWGTPADLAFRPQNLFVAQFVGYKNILPVTHSEDHWITPWGKWKYPHHPGVGEALMVIPPRAWEFSGEDCMSMKMETSVIKDLHWEVQAMMKERSYYLEVSEPQLRSLSQRPYFQARPILADCFLVPL